MQKAIAYQDCLIISDGKLTDISIEHNDVIDVFPIFTIMNEKNTLLVHPLKSGATRVCVLKNGKNIQMFNVKITDDETKIDDADGFEILTLDEPPESWDFEAELDLPPRGMEGGND